MFNNKVLNIISIILFILGLSMIPSALWSYYFNDSDVLLLIYASIITILSGLMIYSITYFNLKNTNKNDLSLKDGFTVVSLSWIMMSFFSALPYYLCLENFTKVKNRFIQYI